MRIEPTLLQAIRQNFQAVRNFYGRLSSRLRIVVAVSGGADSVVLFSLLHRFQELLNLELIVAHFDHQLRNESAADAEFVRRLSSNAGVRFFLGRARPGSRHGNVESWGRRVRYRFLQTVRRRAGADLIVTAHHEHDLAETVLFNLLSGRRITNGMQRFSANRKILRPLLSVSRAMLREFGEYYQLEFVEDQTNFDLSRTRKRIRHELIPQLEREYNPRLVADLVQLQRQLQAEARSLSMQARDWLAQHRCAVRDTLDGVELSLQPDALVLRIFAAAARRAFGSDAHKISERRFRACLRALRRDTKSRARAIQLGGGMVAMFLADRSVSFQYQADTETLSATSKDRETFLQIPGELKRVHENGLSVSVRSELLDLGLLDVGSNGETLIEQAMNQKGDALSQDVAYFDADELSVEMLRVRERQAGDVIRVWKRGSRKLKKLLQEKRVRLSIRDVLPVVEIDGEVIWVPGVARAQVAPVRRDSRRVVKLSYSRNP